MTVLPVDPSFARVNLSDPSILLSSEVVEDLSFDQFCAYGIHVVKGIRSVVISNDLAMGPIDHARWVTIANRICRLWVLKHTLKDKDYDYFEMIAEFIVFIYQLGF